MSIIRSILKSLTGLLLWILISGAAWSQPVNLVTFNIRYDNPGDGEDNWHKRKDKLVELILHYEASVFGIQEGLHHQVEFIDSCLKNFSYTGIGRDDGQTKGEYCAIFYDNTIFKLIRGSTFWLSETPDKVSVGWDAALERICTYGLFEHLETGSRIWIFNTHFDHRGPLARTNSASLILEKIKKIDVENLPVVLMGDFNSTPDEKPVQIIKTSLTDAIEISKNPCLRKNQLMLCVCLY